MSLIKHRDKLMTVENYPISYIVIIIVMKWHFLYPYEMESISK